MSKTKENMLWFGDAVQELMAERDVTYRELADASTLSAGYLNHIVHGNRPVPQTGVINLVAYALGVEASYFIEVRIRRIADALTENPSKISRVEEVVAG